MQEKIISMTDNITNSAHSEMALEKNIHAVAIVGTIAASFTLFGVGAVFGRHLARSSTGVRNLASSVGAIVLITGYMMLGAGSPSTLPFFCAALVGSITGFGCTRGRQQAQEAGLAP